MTTGRSRGEGRGPDAERALVAEVRNGNTELQLWERTVEGKREHELVMNGVFLMASYNHLSSEMLVRTPLERLRTRRDLRVLIGGLGMGFSTGEACRFPNVARIDVVEIEPTILEWNRTFLRNRNEAWLDDERVHIVLGDYHDFVLDTAATYDVIAADIDNGPTLLVRDANRRVYTPGFFARVKALLNPGGYFAVWSCQLETALESIGTRVFGACVIQTVVEHHDGRDTPYFLYLWENP